MTLSDSQIFEWIGAHIWPLFRIASFMMVIPFIGTQLVSMRIRLGLTILLTLLVVPLIPPVPSIELLSLEAVMVTLQQILIGTILGFMFVMMMQLFVVVGQMIAMQIGLGFASMVDPANGVNAPILSQIFLVAITLMYLAMNGHLVMIEVIVETFSAWPISSNILDDQALSRSLVWELSHRISWLFASALVIALPAITAVLIVNLSFGIMTRSAPQMNVFSLGFPIAMLFGLFIIWVATRDLLPQFDQVTRNTFSFLRDVLAR